MSKDILEKLLNTYGEERQLDCASEKLAELIVAISYLKRNKLSNIVEAIAKVEITLDILKVIFDCHEYINEYKKNKLNTLEKQLTINKS